MALVSSSPNLDNLKLSLSKLMGGRNAVRTKGLGTKRGKLRLKLSPLTKLKPMKMTPPTFMQHQATGSVMPNMGGGMS